MFLCSSITGRKKLWSTLLRNVFCWKWANSATVLGRFMGSCLLCQLSFYGMLFLFHLHDKQIIWWRANWFPVSGFDIFNRSISVSLPRTSHCLSGNLLFSGRLCIRCWVGCRRFSIMPWTVSATQSTERFANDFDNNTGNFRIQTYFIHCIQ